MDVDLTEHLDLHIPGYEYLWNCPICLTPAISGVVLSFSGLSSSMILYFIIYTTPPGLNATNAIIVFILSVFLTLQTKTEMPSSG